MEVMYSNKNVFEEHIISFYKDKIDLLNYDIDINGISYDDKFKVSKFLNGDTSKIKELLDEFEISVGILNKYMYELSRGELKLILLIYVLLKNKECIILDYFDKGLSFKIKKRVINYLKTKYKGYVIAISNDLVFLNLISDSIIIYKDNEELFNGKFEDLYKDNIKIDYPEVIKFIRLANDNDHKLNYTIDNKELLKDIYRSVS